MRKEDFVYNDFLLIRKMKQGDDNAFDLFVHKYYQKILSYCYHHCFDQTYAEDFTQETFIRFFSNEYYGAAEPPVRCGESHLSGLTEPPHFVY